MQVTEIASRQLSIAFCRGYTGLKISGSGTRIVAVENGIFTIKNTCRKTIIRDAGTRAIAFVVRHIKLITGRNTGGVNDLVTALSRARKTIYQLPIRLRQLTHTILVTRNSMSFIVRAVINQVAFEAQDGCVYIQ